MKNSPKLTLVFMTFCGIFIFASLPAWAQQWAKTYGGVSVDYANSIQPTSDGGYIVAGETFSFGAGNSDFWVLKLDASGNVQWQKTYGGGNWDRANSIHQTSDGAYIVAGETRSFHAGNSDFWVLKLDANGNISNCTPADLVKNSSAVPAKSTGTPSGSGASISPSSATVLNTSVTPTNTSATTSTQCPGS